MFLLLAASCFGNQDKLWPDEPVLAPKASLFFFLLAREIEQLNVYITPIEFDKCSKFQQRAVYRFQCDLCDAGYVCYTCKHLHTPR